MYCMAKWRMRSAIPFELLKIFYVVAHTHSPIHTHREKSIAAHALTSSSSSFFYFRKRICSNGTKCTHETQKKSVSLRCVDGVDGGGVEVLCNVHSCWSLLSSFARLSVCSFVCIVAHNFIVIIFEMYLLSFFSF